jgi:hypothetical protein
MIQLPSRSRLGLTATLGLCWTLSAHGAWQAVPTILFMTASQDNARLEPDALASETSARTWLDATLDLASYNQRGFVTFTPRVQSNVYADVADAELESDDWYFEGTGEYRWSVVTLGFRGDFREQAVQRSELLEVDEPVIGPDGEIIVDPDATDSGRLIFIDESRQQFMFRPYINFRLSERSTLAFQLSTRETSYSGGDNIARTGFENRSLQASVVRRVDEQNQVSATLIVTEYQAYVNGTQTDTFGVEGGIRRRVSEIWSANFTVGVQRSDFVFEDLTQQVVDNAAASYTLRLHATKRGERSTLDFGVDRLLSPNSSGYLTERNEFSMYLNQELTQRLSTRFGVRLNQSAAVGDAAPLNDRDYKRLEINLDWALKERWTLTAGYDNIVQEFTQQTTGERSSATIYIGIGYRGLSRPGAPR